MTHESVATTLACADQTNLIDHDLRLRLALRCHRCPVNDASPCYEFRMRRDQEVAGAIHLPGGNHPSLINHLGDIGYEAVPRFRGRAFAQRAAQLLLPLARLNGMKDLWITC